MRFAKYKEQWQQKLYKDIAEIIGGGTPDTENPAFWNGSINWFTPSEVGSTKYVSISERMISIEGLNNSNAKLLPKGTILLTSRATIGEMSIAENDCATNQGFQSLIAKKNVNVDFLYYLSNTKKKHFIKYACGSTFLEISNYEIRKTKCYTPNIDEQKEIGYFLSKIDSRIETQNKIIKEYETYRNWIINHIFGNINSYRHERLDKLCTITTGKKDANAMSKNGIYKFFTCSREDYLINTYSFEGESLLISGNGELGLIKYFNGKFDAYQRTYVLQNFVINAKYIKFFLEYFMPRKIHKEKNVGAMPYIVLSTLSTIDIPLLDSKKIEQISKTIDLIDEKIQKEKDILSAYKKQKAYLLQNMFI